MFNRFIIATIIILLTGAGCANHEGGFKLPGVYRVDIQQGNVIEQEMLERLRYGMDKNQVRYIMGTPVLIDPFHTNRWEYIYTFSRRGGQRQQTAVSLYFDENDKLANIEGDVTVDLHGDREDILRQTQIVDVPLKKKKYGLFRKMLNILPFVGDDEPRPSPRAEVDDTKEKPGAEARLVPEETLSTAGN